MSAYFSLLEKTLRDHDLFDKPSFVFNMDESGLPLDYKQPKRVATKGMKKLHGPASGDKTQITIIACLNAAGYILSPMVIFKHEKFNYQWSTGELPSTLYGMSKSGIVMTPISLQMHSIELLYHFLYFLLTLSPSSVIGCLLFWPLKETLVNCVPSLLS